MRAIRVNKLDLKQVNQDTLSNTVEYINQTKKIKGQLTDATKKSHALHLGSVKVDEWNILEGSNRPMRMFTLVAPMSVSDSEGDMIVDSAPNIIDKFWGIREKTEE